MKDKDPEQLCHQRGRASLDKEVSISTPGFGSNVAGVVVVGLDDRVTAINKEFIDLWKISDAVEPGSDASLVLTHLSGLMTVPDTLFAELGGPLSGDETKTQWHLKDGRVIEIEAKPQIEDSHITGRILICRDKTEQPPTAGDLDKRDAFLSAMFENMTDSIMVCDADGKITDLRRRRSDHAGDRESTTVTPAEWPERFELLKPDGKTLMKMTDVPLYRALHEGKVSGDEMVTRSAGGELLTMITTGQAIVDENDQKLGAVVLMHDITERKKAEIALQQNEFKLRSVIENLSEGLVEVDPDETILFVNDRFCALSGYDREELLGQKTLDLFFDELSSKLISKVNRDRRRGIAGNYELPMRSKSGDILHVIIGGTPIFDAAGTYTGTMAVFTDITERKRTEERSLHDALHDDLTGLANRVLFMEHLQMTIKRNGRGKKNLFAVLFFDFDRFKVLNDSLGHAAGDQLLKKIAERLESGLRTGDLVARLGGDEFTILLNGLPSEQSAFLLAERIQEDLRLPFEIEGREIFTSASIGIAFCSPGNTAEDVLRDADIAMYRAKAKGKACFQVFDKEMHESAIKRLQLETELRQAIRRREFFVCYQPIVDLDTHHVMGFEALIRWNHPERGVITPGEFIPAAEENNMILAIGSWMLYESCQQMRKWQTEIPGAENLQISVNLSLKEFSQIDLVDRISDILKKTELRPECLKLEITESHLMENTDIAVSMMNRLRVLGVQLSLDDFGTGYSSLSYLHRLPVTFLKIDRSFIGRMTECDDNREIVKTIIRLARNLKMRVVAEGIETQGQLEQLKSLGCEFGQGFFFSKPMTSEFAGRFIEQFLGYSSLSRKIERLVTLDTRI